MTRFHAVMIDECGEEFGVDVEANSRNEAYDILDEDYPESRVDCLESPTDVRERMDRMYRAIARENYYDA